MKRKQRSLTEIWQVSTCTTTTRGNYEGENAITNVSTDSTDKRQDAGSLNVNSNNVYEGDLTRLEDVTATAEGGKCACTHLCCNEEQKACQRVEPVVLSTFVNKGRKFLPAWF